MLLGHVESSKPICASRDSKASASMAASEWRGDETKLQQLCQMFEAGSSADSGVQQQVMQMLSQFSQLPDFNMYLVAVFAQMPSQPEVVRQRAGLLLKTNVTKLQAGTLQPVVAEHINGAALAQLQDASRVIRHTAGSILTTMVQKVGLSACGQTLERLVDNLGSQSQGVVEGSLSALSKVCEDEVTLLGQLSDLSPATAQDMQLFVTWSAQRLLPRVFEIATPSSPPFARQSCLECLNHFALGGTFNKSEIPGVQGFPALEQFGERYIEVLGTMASDTVPEVLQGVCKGFACVVENSWRCLSEQHYQIILNFMLKACQNPEYSVRLEALAVWSPCCETMQTWNLVKVLLPDLVPALLINMIYSDADYMCMEQAQLEDDNAALPDLLDDIKPRFAKDKLGDAADEDDDNGKGGGAWGAEWTVRKAAASSLDRLSTVFQDEVVKLVLPHIEQKLQHAAWEHQEVGVLAMGAIAAACWDKLAPFLPKVMEMLIGLTATPKPLVRSISCWCICRFSAWICDEQTANREQILSSVLKAILQRCLDRNKRVQEAACSALATLIESALVQLAPYLEDIVRTLVTAFQLYQTKNFRILYDAVGTLAWAVGWELDRPQLVEALLTPVMQKFETVPDNDLTTISLFECVSNLVQNLRHSLLPVIPRIIQRCMRIIGEVTRATQMFDQNPNEYEQPDSELMAASLDLLAGIIEGLLDSSGQVVMQSNFLAMLPEVLRCKSMRVKQSGFALMGSAASHCMEQLGPHLPQLLPLCATGLVNGMTTMVSHNASWAIGEVCVRVSPAIIDPHVDILLAGFIQILNRKDGIDIKPWQRQGHRALLGNVCITIGRLGTVCTDRCGKELQTFLMPWCIVMRTQRPDREKIKAFEGLCAMIQANPMAGAQCFPFLAGAISTLPPQLTPEPQMNVLKQILHGYKTHFGAQWPEVFNGLPPDVNQRLSEWYQVTL